ncbi:hypothetical protein L7F22_051714 [Adiantum nelumboides]|nr:hypothetical protein [Adiantum nelumboides]
MVDFSSCAEVVDQADSADGLLDPSTIGSGEQSGEGKSVDETHLQGGKEQEGLAQSFVIVYNVAKRHNIGTLARCATAFGVSEMILVGKHKDFNAFGSHGAAAHIQYRHFFTLGDARSHLKKNECDIIGIEITDGAMPVQSHPFTRSTAFLLGNEGTGLSDKEMAICDYFIYIAQYGGGTASLNVTVAASIVLHHFAVWAGFSERARIGHKFEVADRPSKQQQRVICTETPEMVAEIRRLKQRASDDWFQGGEQCDSEILNSNGQEIVSPGHESSSILTRLFEVQT